MYQKIAMLLSAAGCVVAVACSQSDPGITTAVKSKLAKDDTVKAYQIDVDTSDKVVTLRGMVDTSAAKDQAVMIARGTNGVRDVVDHITVNSAAPTTGDLDDDARELGADTRDAAGRAGEATKDAARDAKDKAGDAAGRAGAAMTDAAVTAAVKSKLLADATVSGLSINVDTNDGVVTLKGRAKTKAESDRAVMLARQTDGAKRVVNNIEIAR
jgi:hyperosmotically inducible periplasmic protein